MHSTTISSIAAQRAPMSGLVKLLTGSLISLALALVYLQTVIIGQFAPPLTVIAGLLLLAIGLNATGWRWTPLVGATLSAITIIGNIDHILYDLSHPEALHLFAFNLVATELAVVGVAAGLAAGVQNYRSSRRTLPRGTVTTLIALMALTVGAVLVAALPRGSGSSISPEVLAQLRAVTTPGMEFGQPELRAQVGETVALRLDNTHTVPHSFDIDELNVHVPVDAGEQSLILFTPAQPGSYTFYCGVPGHREAGMVGTLVVGEL